MCMKTNRFSAFNHLCYMETKTLRDDISKFATAFIFAPQISGKTFLITGATGLIGSIIIKCLLKIKAEDGCEMNIIGVCRDAEKPKKIFGKDFDRIQWVVQVLSEPFAVPLPPIHYIIHCASPTASKFLNENPVETMRDIYAGTDELLKLARAKNIESMVYLSSIETYGVIEEEGSVAEDTAGYVSSTNTRSSYPIAKRAAECLCHAYCKEYSVPVKIARLTQVFGAGVQKGDSRVFAQFARSIINGEDIVLHTSGESSKPYCYTTDAVNALFYILLRGENGEAYNVANEETFISIKEMAHMLADRFSQSSHVRIESHSDLGYAPITKVNLSTKKLKSLGWAPKVGLEEMFERLIQHLKEM